MSGGVDSSVAAYLLQKQGYDVHGLFITIWNPPHIPCTTIEDQQSAMRACAALGIPFIQYDASHEYEEKVIKPFVNTYREGGTPNPDVLCNTHIKFGVVHSFLRQKGFSTIATGHYAQVQQQEGHNRLYRSVDDGKDQTYFIYTLPQETLDTLMFPVGGYTKKQVRAIAERARLPAAARKDSTGLCFLGAVSMKDFLSAYIEPKRGAVLSDDTGNEIGTHDGAWFYTVGQRHGFTVTDPDRGPYIVVGRDVSANTLSVCHRDRYNPTTVEFRVCNTIFRRFPDENLFARYRHRGDIYPVSVQRTADTTATVSFSEPHFIAPGQSIVLYTHDGECIGGGIVTA